MALEEEKRNRILNAAMREFCAGYRNASTDSIVREAGISKGLLFHYFGTKEKLYEFLLRYALDTIMEEYFGLINVKQRDLLENVWQMTLLKRDLCFKYPAIFDFLANVYLRSCPPGPGPERLKEDGPDAACALEFCRVQQKISDEIFKNFNTSLFREDIDPYRAADILWWMINGYASREVSADKTMEDYQSNYERYLEDLGEYFAVFKKCFYK